MTQRATETLPLCSLLLTRLCHRRPSLPCIPSQNYTMHASWNWRGVVAGAAEQLLRPLKLRKPEEHHRLLIEQHNIQLYLKKPHGRD